MRSGPKSLDPKIDQLLNAVKNGEDPQSYMEMLRINLSNLKNSGFTDDDLKPYLDKISAGGYNIGPDYSLTKVPNSGQGGGYTPATPVGPKEVIPGTNIDVSSDRGQIETESGREQKQLLDANQQATDLRSQGLSSLADILNKQNQAQFNYDLPGIKEDLGNSGLFTSPSALAAAVARESGMLGSNTAAQLGQAGVQNINLQAQGLLGAHQNSIGMQQGGLQRQFSVSDYDKQAALAREIGAMQVPNAPSPFGGIASGAASGAIAGSTFGMPAAGAAGGAGLALLNNLTSGGKGGGGTYICTAMKEAGILTQEEVSEIHDHLFPIFPQRFLEVLAYGIYGPQLVSRATEKGIDWSKWKEFFFGKVVGEKDQNKAFDLYRNAFIEMWKEVF